MASLPEVFRNKIHVLLLRIVNFLDRQSKGVFLISGIIVIMLLGIVDYLTGYEYRFSLFYIIPVSFTTWFTGSYRIGAFMALFSSIIWLAADIASGHTYSHPVIPVWNTLVVFLFFYIIMILLLGLKRAYTKERELSRIDPLTRLLNLRGFLEVAEREIERQKRYGGYLTFALIDLDNFKMVNDRLGHAEGNNMLEVISSIIKNNTRSTDVIVRLGGDEFGILFPQTDGVYAEKILKRIQKNLSKLENKNNLKITLSIGVAVFKIPPPSVEAMIKIADELMYGVKNKTKNDVLVRVIEQI